jgi:nucleotide-binding universal stress UspA family protein
MENGSLQFKTITVATDLSHESSSALRYAQALAAAHHAALLVVHVIDPMGYAFPESEPSFHEAGRAAAEELNRIEEETRLMGIPVHSVMETGTICERILEAVKNSQTDLLIIGTRGKTEAGRIALGRIARRLLAKSPCPIMTVSPSAETSMPLAGFWRRVLAATDFSPASIAALKYAHQVVLRQLIALHVSGCQREGGCSSCEGRLRFMAPFNESHTVPVEHIVMPGNAGEVISWCARRNGVDLVVLGSPAEELADEDLETSTVLQVVSRVSCPVLCVPVARRRAAVGDVIREVACA